MMKPRLFSALALAASALAATGCGKPPAPAAPAVAVVAAPGIPISVQGYTGTAPGGWIAEAPSSSMRFAQFAVPAAAPLEAGEVAAFFFGPGQGGSQEANIERWASQFAGADGKTGIPAITSDNSGALAVTLVELRGLYSRGVGMGPDGEAKPDQTLLIALVETPVGRITLQIYGPSKTVAAHRDGFVKLAKGFRAA